MIRFLSISITAIFLTSTAYAGIFKTYQILTEDVIIETYSRGWDGDDFNFSRDQIWGITLEKENVENCIATLSGYAKKPSYRGSSTYKFWVCIIKNSKGHLDAEFLDDQEVADE